MRVLLFTSLLIAVVAANVGTVSSAPSEGVQKENVSLTAHVTTVSSASSPGVQETSTFAGPTSKDRTKWPRVCEPGTEYSIWGVRCICAADGKGVDCEGVPRP